jgi:Domain of unknown function (DUF4198)
LITCGGIACLSSFHQQITIMDKIRKIFFSLIFLTILQTGLAHEFWLMPGRFRVPVGACGPVKFWVGENFQGEDWGNKKERTLQVTHWAPQGPTDLTAPATASDSNNLVVEFKTPGTHLITLRSKNSAIELEADKFNVYLEEDGIEDILAQRQQNPQPSRKVRELYQRCAKTLLQVGGQNDDNHQRITGMPLEIVPLDNPYQRQVGDSLRVWVPLAEPAQADYQSYWASLTFEL